MFLTLLLVILGTQTSKTQQSVSESVDVVLLIDSSNTLGRHRFLLLKNSVNKMINSLPIEPNKYRLALVQYNDDIHVEFQLDDFKGKNPMLNHVKKFFSFRGGPLKTGNAIQKVHETFFKTRRRDRQQVLIISTSGISEDDVEGPATLMRKEGIKIIALGMPTASEQELKSMATFPLSYHFNTSKELQKVSSNILSVIESALAINENLVISTTILPSLSYSSRMPIKDVDCSQGLIADVVFLVDEAVSPENSKDIVSFLQNTATSLDVRKSCIRIGLVTYSNEPHILSQLNTETEIKDLILKIKRFSPRQGQAKLGSALNFTSEKIFAESAGSRTKGVSQIATIITHRPSEDSLEEASSLLFQKGVTVFAISIEGANITQLRGIVSYPPEMNIIKLNDFSNLANESKIFEKKLFNLVFDRVFAQSKTTAEVESGCTETEKADIYFLVDGSSSIDPLNFIKMKTFLKEIIKLFTIGPDYVRFGVVQFGTSNQTEFELDQHMKTIHLEKAINNMMQMGRDTYTGAALHSMLQLFEKAKKQRDGKVPCYLIVLTDGEAHDNVLEPSKMLRNSGVNIYAIGVKPANTTQLNEIADSESNVYYVEQFDFLKNIKNEIVRDLCSEKACKEMKADVMFLVDSSGSISNQNFEKMKKFMKELVKRCSVGPNKVQFGVVQFSSNNKEEFQLKSSKDSIIDGIQTMNQMNGDTYTGEALKFVSDYFKTVKGARFSVKKILILITDGEAHDDVGKPASALRKEGVIIYSIGVVGSNRTQLLEISGEYGKTFYLGNYDVLNHIEKDIVFGICTPYDPKECKRVNRLDLVFVIDSSSSVSDDYILMKNFIIALMNKSYVSKDHVQFGAIKYSDNPETMFKLNTYSKRSDIIQAIQNDKPLYGNTYTERALSHSKSLLTEENGSRINQGVPQVLMVITDGESHDTEKLNSTSEELRKKGTIIYAIGIKDAKPKELEIMAGSKDRWFYMSSFQGLENITTSLSEQLCNDSKSECLIKAQLVILTDSGSIPGKDLEFVKNFLINLLKSIIHKDNILVGMAQFSNTLHEVFQLADYQNVSELYSKITDLKLVPGSSLIGHALKKVKGFFKTDKQKVKRSINKKLLIFTDGRSDDDISEAANDLRADGVEIHAVAIGDVTFAKVLQITEYPSRIYKFPEPNELKDLEKKVQKGICKDNTEATCFVDVIIGFDISSQKPGDHLFSKQRHLEIHLPDIITGLTSLSNTNCSKDKRAQFSVTISVENTDKPFLKKIINVDGTDIIKELRSIVVNRPTHLNIAFLDAIWNLAKTDTKNRNTVLLLFSDGLDDDIIALGQKSDDLRKKGLDGLITVALEGAKYIDQLQHIEFGKGFGYKTQLSIDTENIVMRFFQYMDQIAERKCCCIFCTCEGEEGPRGKKGEKGPMGTTAYMGHRGYPGDDGEQGTRGIPGIQGNKGDIGGCGTRGQKGQRGLNGERGQDGADGVDGIYGEEGSLGFPGLKGEMGNPGEMGNSGPKGPPGDLGTTGFQGDQGEPGQDSNIRGAKGFKGLSGRMGERRLKGSDGSPGSPGNKGAEGNTGVLGPKGEEGYPGSDGLQGDQGVQGSQGSTGVHGAKGGKGQPGNTGRLGDIGDEGPKGNQGKPGSRGNKGESGEPGEKGGKGSHGQQGIRGEEGTFGFGNIGRKGRMGIEGFHGDFGEQGIPGDMGNPGKPGLKGKRGRTGTPGLAGDNGEIGSWGYPGSLGPKGAKSQSFYSPCQLIEYIQRHSPCWTKISKCPAYPTELVFALDISQDTNFEIFEEMRKTVIGIVNQINITESNCPVGAKVAVVSYSSNTNYLIRFTDFQRKDKLLQELKRLSFQRTTNRRDIGGSMKFVARHLFKRTRQSANVRKVAVFFSNGESDYPDSIGTAVLEFTALDIQPAVISFKNTLDITQAFEMDTTGLFQVINFHQNSLERILMCVICYDKCKPDEFKDKCKPEGPPIKSEAYLDAVFILENSRKLSTAGFEELKHFLSSALDSFEISTNPKTSLIGDRIAVVSHAPPNFQFQKEGLPVKIEFDLVTHESKRQMKRHIENFAQKLNGEAALGHAIDWTINNIFSEELGQREVKAIFVISVGETSHWDKKVLSDAALRAKCNGYAIFVVSIGREYDYLELTELASLPLEHHMVQLGRIHKAELEYAVKFLKPLIHLLKNKMHSYPDPELQRICSKISYQSPPVQRSPPNKIYLVDENGSAFPEYPQSDSLFPEKMVSNAHSSVVFGN